MACVRGMSENLDLKKKLFSVGGENKHHTMSGRSSPVAAISDDGWWDVEPTGLIDEQQQAEQYALDEQVDEQVDDQANIQDLLDEQDEIAFTTELWAFIEHFLSRSTPRRSTTPTAESTGNATAHSAAA